MLYFDLYLYFSPHTQLYLKQCTAHLWHCIRRGLCRIPGRGGGVWSLVLGSPQSEKIPFRCIFSCFLCFWIFSKQMHKFCSNNMIPWERGTVWTLILGSLLKSFRFIGFDMFCCIFGEFWGLAMHLSKYQGKGISISLFGIHKGVWETQSNSFKRKLQVCLSLEISRYHKIKAYNSSICPHERVFLFPVSKDFKLICLAGLSTFCV